MDKKRSERLPNFNKHYGFGKGLVGGIPGDEIELPMVSSEFAIADQLCKIGDLLEALLPKKESEAGK